MITYPARAQGLVAPEAEAAFLMPPLPPRPTKKEVLPLVSEVGLDKARSRSLPKLENGREG